jgi:hypothetical protein
MGVHAAEAILFHMQDKSHSAWHARHMKAKREFPERRAAAQVAEQEGVPHDLEICLVISAMRFRSCRPLNFTRIMLGWYDGDMQELVPVSADPS